MVFAGWIASLKKIDFDEVFAYETLKTVIVRDRRLGFLHYFFMMVIFIYIVYSIISKQLYLIKDPIIRGAIRSTAYPPSTFATTYPYCRTTASTCLFLGANDVAQPEDGSIFVSTRVSITNATLQCPLHQLPTSPSCIPTFNKPDAQLFYVAGIENYTIMIEHSLTSFTTHRVIQNRFLKGTLLNKNGDPFRVYLPSTVQETDKKDAIETVGTNEVVVRNASIPGDLFTVQDLMVASGVTDLERIQNSQSIRHEGTVLVVVINYANRLSAIDDVKYTYQIGYIEGTEAKRVVNRYTPDGLILQEWNHHGLHILFVQTGYTGKFEFMALLQSLVASIALLGVAKLLVEQLMIRALKERHVYKSYKYEVTEDFSDRYTPQKSSPSSSIPLPPDLSKSFSPPTTIQDTSKPTEGSNGGVISTSFKEDV